MSIPRPVFAPMAMSALIMCSFFAVSTRAALSPKWFPEKSCREAWGGRDLTKYDFARDRVLSVDGNIGYSNYKKRLAAESTDRKSCFKDWTILVYMAADNDLSPYALWDVDEMEGNFASGRYAGSTLKSDLIVSLDTEGPNGVRRLHVFQREDHPYVAATDISDYDRRSPRDIASPIVHLEAERGTLRTSAKAKLEAFLNWGVREYPAKNYMVIVWGHGQGWAGASVEPTRTSRRPSAEVVAVTSAMSTMPQAKIGRFGGILADPSTGTSLSVPSLRDALASVVTKTLAGKPFAVYASDACLMQMAEVASEIAPTARYIVGSAQVQSFVGLPYRRFMYELNSGRFLSTGRSVGKSDEALLLAKMLPELTESSLDPQHGQQGRNQPGAIKTFTMSSLSSEALLGDLVPAIRNFSRMMRTYLEEDFFRGADLTFAMKNAPSFMGGGRELGSFLSLVELSRTAEIAKLGRETKSSRDLGRTIDDARRALEKTVIERRFGTSYQTADVQFHLLGYRALGVWVPNGPHEFKERASDFALSSFEKNTDWQSWLGLALGAKP